MSLLRENSITFLPSSYKDLKPNPLTLSSLCIDVRFPYTSRIYETYNSYITFYVNVCRFEKKSANHFSKYLNTMRTFPRPCGINAKCYAQISYFVCGKV